MTIFKSDKQNTDKVRLSKVQQDEILRREADFESGKIKAESWKKVRKRFLK